VYVKSTPPSTVKATTRNAIEEEAERKKEGRAHGKKEKELKNDERRQERGKRKNGIIMFNHTQRNVLSSHMLVKRPVSNRD
jgi:hypothetical protein